MRHPNRDFGGFGASRMLRLLSLTVAIVAVLAIPAPAFAHGHTPWSMFQHDLRHTGRSLAVGPQSANLRWSFPTPGIPGSPAVGGDGTIYLPVGALHSNTTGYLYAVNPDGTQRWRVQLAGPPSSTAPAIAPDGTIYVHANGPENVVSIERLYAVDPSGSIDWTFEFNGGFGIFTSSVQSSPAVAADGTIYIGSMDTNLYALNTDGTVRWARSPTVSSIESSPAVAPDGTIYIVDVSTKLFAYSPTGALRWSYQLSDVPIGTANDQSPSIGSDGTVYVGSPWGTSSSDGHLYAIRPDGTLRWRFLMGKVRSTPAIGADGTVHIGSNGLYALNPDGTQRWRFLSGAVPFSSVSPVIGGDGTIYWRESFQFYAVSSSGAAKWQLNVGSFPSNVLDSTPALGSDGTLYMPHANAFDGSQNGLRAYSAVPQAPPPPPGPPPSLPPPPAAPPPPRPQVRCRVPRVIGLRLPTAKTRIRRANCRVGRVRRARSRRSRVGRVVSQRPRPGLRRPRGTRISLVVGRG
jgi:outer membrane protein assembly factor BamB